MLKPCLWVGSCLAVGLLLGLLIADVITVRRVPAPDLEIASAATPEGPVGQQPAAALATEPEQPSAERTWISSKAEALLRELMAESWTGLEGNAWDAQYEVEERFIVDAPEDSTWITVTSARVPCERVDDFLAKQNDPEFGTPDRCDRWLRAAAETLAKHGIEDRGPGSFLNELGADRSVRVMLLYAGWQRDPNRSDEIQLVHARPVPVYPQAEFTKQRSAAQNAIYQAMKLGPYAYAQR
jgi:hypothetical protein